MTKTDEFDELKLDALNKGADYMDKIKNLTYEDLKSVKKRLDLLDAYNKAVLSNAAYRIFINENVRSSLKK